MKYAKWFLLASLLVIVLASSTACFNKPPETTMSSQQVAAIIAFQAAPALDYYLQQGGKQPTNSQVIATGEWVAVHKGGGEWEIKGQVVVKFPKGDKTCSTTWTMSQKTSTVKLIEFNYPP